MSKRFGKKRVPGCECTESFTCRKCLDAGVLTVPAVHGFANVSRHYRCAFCDVSFRSDKPQDPERDRGFGTCESCKPTIAADMVKHGFAGRKYTLDEAKARQNKYA